MFVQMVQNYKRKRNPKMKLYSPNDMKENPAEGLQEFFIYLTGPSMIICPEHGTLELGCRPVLLPETELSISQHLATFADHGYAFNNLDLTLFV